MTSCQCSAMTACLIEAIQEQTEKQKVILKSHHKKFIGRYLPGTRHLYSSERLHSFLFLGFVFCFHDNRMMRAASSLVLVVLVVFFHLSHIM